MAPKNAPTISRQSGRGEINEEWICTICGYVYSDPDISFEDLHADWACPCAVQEKESVFQREMTLVLHFLRMRSKPPLVSLEGLFWG